MTSCGRAVFLLRHTRTTWNDESRYQGQLDSPLSDEGRLQVVQIASLVSAGVFDAIYTSPLSRARILAGAIADRAGVPLIVDDRLTEIDMGSWQGLVREEIEDRFGPMFNAWSKTPDKVTFPGGESLQLVANRIDPFLDELFADQLTTRTLVVSHNSVLKVALMQALGLEMSNLHNFHIRNGSVSILREHGLRRSVECIDCLGHLTNSPFALSHR